MNRRRKSGGPGARVTCDRPIGVLADIGVRRHASTCAALLRESVKWIDESPDEDLGRDCQRMILSNLAWCLNESLVAMAILLDHEATGAVLILERAAIEYYGRAKYYLENPEHAIWTFEVERLQVLIDNEDTSPAERTEMIRALHGIRGELAHLTPEARIAKGEKPFHAIKIIDMIRLALNEDAVRRYRSASVAIHGDLYTTRIARDRAAEAINTSMLEGAASMIAFANLIMSWLSKAPKGLLERLLQAEDETARLAKRYEGAFLVDSSGAA